MSQDSKLPMAERQPKRRSLTDVRVASAVITAWQQPLDLLVTRRPAPGEVWRLEFSGEAALALVLERTDDTLLVAAVGDDPAYADAATLLLDKDESPTGYAVGVWMSVTAHAPDFVADRLLGELSGELFDMATQLYGWVTYDLACDVPADRRGRAVTGDPDPVVDYRVLLRDDLDQTIQPAIELIRESDRTTQAHEEQGGQSLGDLLRQADVRPRELAKALGWPRLRAQRAYEGLVLLSGAELEVVANLVRQPANTVAAAAGEPPPALVVAVHRPKARANVHTLAEREEVPDPVARAEAIEGAVAMRTRAVGTTTEWEQVLDDYFRGVL